MFCFKVNQFYLSAFLVIKKNIFYGLRAYDLFVLRCISNDLYQHEF